MTKQKLSGRLKLRSDRSGAAALGLVRRSAGAFDLADQEFELGDFDGEGGTAGFCEGDPGAGAFARVALLDGDEPGVLQWPSLCAREFKSHPACFIDGGPLNSAVATVHRQRCNPYSAQRSPAG